MNLRSKFAAAALSGAIVVGGVAVLGGVGYGIGYASGYFNESTVTATINDKAIQVKGNDSTYMIYTTKGVYTDGDSLVKHKWNSSDVYNGLEKGCTYQFNVHGWRNHFLSMYPNIDSQTFVPTKACPTAPQI